MLIIRKKRNFNQRYDARRVKKVAEEVLIDSPAKLDTSREGIYMVPLSGVREFGANATLYYANKMWILVDIGNGFNSDDSHGFTTLMPDLSFVRKLPREQFGGVFVTHGHEDHVGGVARSIKEIENAMRAQRPEQTDWKLPIYATPFTLSLLEKKLDDIHLKEPPLLYKVQPGDIIDVGPFSIRAISVTHSIPENLMFYIDALINDDTGRRAGILHTGDWRFDRNPVVGEISDTQSLEALQKEDVLAVVCDSTHAMTDGSFKSEKDVKDSLESIIAGIKKGRVVVVCFSTNLSRVDSCARIAQKVGRRLGLIGRSLYRIQEIAEANGYLQGVEKPLTEKEIMGHDRNEILIVTTGSQGEQNSGMRRLSEQTHPNVTLEAGDTIIMSARMITGKEAEIDKMLNKCAERGINVITTSHDADIHVSGHPPKEDLKELYRLVKPKSVIPVHGTSIPMLAQEKLANQEGLKSMFIQAGDFIFVGPTSDPKVTQTPRGQFVNTLHLTDVLTKVARIKTGKTTLDGNTIVPFDGQMVHDRMQLKYGCVVVSVMIKPDGNFSKEVQLQGVCEEYEENFKRELYHIIEVTISKISPDSRKSHDTLSGAIRHAIRSYFTMRRSTDPLIIVLTHMPRGIVTIDATQSTSGTWSLKLSPAYCEPDMIKAMERSLIDIAAQLSSGKKLPADRIVQRVKEGIDRSLSQFDRHFRPNVLVNLHQPEGANDGDKRDDETPERGNRPPFKRYKR